VKWFTVLNLKEIYYRIRIKKEEEWKMMFWMRYRHYKYTVMSFKLKNASAMFQKMINNTIHKYLDDFVMTYLDDILIYLKTLKEHERHIKVIMKALQKWMLSINEKKSVFKS